MRLASEFHGINPRVSALENSSEIPALDPRSSDFDAYQWLKAVSHDAREAGVRFQRLSISFINLSVSGFGPLAPFHADVASIFKAPANHIKSRRQPPRTILNGFDGLLKAGEMLLVLGRPGSGCTTLLKTLAGQTHDLRFDGNSRLSYNGLAPDQMMEEHKGEVIYNSEGDNHFPHLTVAQTLEFAATLRTPRNHIVGVSRNDHIRQVVMVALSICGLAHTEHTKVGNDFVRGVSGGERKRVSIAEMILALSSVGLWDNSTRGLDSATALDFIQALRMSADIVGTAHAVAVYQASQAIFDTFDKVTVLYEGRQIYFGAARAAKAYFEEMGWLCPSRQTTGDFLTSITNYKERIPRQGFEDLVPRTPEDFEKYWRSSHNRTALIKKIEEHEREMIDHVVARDYRASRQAAKSGQLLKTSPYTVSILVQIKACTKRAYQRLWNDKASTLTVVLGQIIMGLVVGSVYYGVQNSTGSFFARGSTLFFAVLLNALIAITEINNLYQQRPIVQKHTSYAFCHPSAEALAGVISDAPIKLFITCCFNPTLYFLAGLRAEPSQFFIFFLFTLLVRFTMSAMFRSLAAVTRTVSQALALAGVLVLAIVIYTGYTIPRSYMHPWFKWLTWINPLSYAFEALMVNEFHGRNFTCASFVPTDPDFSTTAFICDAAGAVAGQQAVSGDAYVQVSFGYRYTHLWRNLGIVISFWLFFLVLYLFVSEMSSPAISTIERLLFLQRSSETNDHEVAQLVGRKDQRPAENGPGRIAQDARPVQLAPQRSIFSWRDLVYDIQIKERPRRLIDGVSGWVKPGTLTVLMGVSGAGKTTLLDVLAQRIFIHGVMLVDGKPLKPSFQRNAGYVQQQDVHLETSTVREALRFSAVLRQSKKTSLEEKYSHVEHIIEMLDMSEFSEAIIGMPGQGLNITQRKLLTIGVELAAKPEVLIFLDEPTSGLDSQSAWVIVALLRKLADSGQAILATIHQPSPILFLEFDRLLFLAKGGRTVYFGDIGPNAETLIDYFERQGARSCRTTENPAEYILEQVTIGSDRDREKDWPALWNMSDECSNMKTEQTRLQREADTNGNELFTEADSGEFAVPFSTQAFYTTLRVFQQYWRTPSYIYGKLLLGVASAFFIGFSFFNADSSIQGLQNVVFSIFMLTSVLSSLVQQIMPRFVSQRSLYEVRERPSKVYSWAAFILANIIVEFLYQIVLGVLVYACYYYPILGIQSSERQVLILISTIQIFVFASTFAHMVIVTLPDAQTAGAVATLLFSLTMIFNGVFQPPQALPGFWIFMYRISPLTYIVGAVAGTGLHGRAVRCSTAEMKNFSPPAGSNCGAYLSTYLVDAAGQLTNPEAETNCQYCPLTIADQFLGVSEIKWSERWRNVGIVFAYILFNIMATFGLYYVFKVRRWRLHARVSKMRDWAWSILAMWFGQAI
ncbi:hypothetical protein AUEXF2481DRAFT_70340 [Aureobasidium subglaciale EXF-2481]|uniref:ABC transporter domain-containing protein n=1 Tax=Aureobasidium subglaciale (strain EXF-2481) TaxID=1043005 RepID=A0A074Y013_AURSE|nr:uncharacterized protein AUEXF2481DRAFT_70340 [Aureobasidium subglaciale EXF-2481]KEQ91070.1 hypothetical protein AUEXF2481DRAFT_70340 [Aureobasidium subglaciale EXF-2481]